jgi:hypothetical protein
MELTQSDISVAVCRIRLMPYLFLKHLTGFNQHSKNLNTRHLRPVLQSEQTQILFISLFT